MALNLTKHYGPLTAEEALDRMDAGTDSLYVVEFQETDPDEDISDRLVRGCGAFFHGFIMAGDVIKQITVWKD